MTPTTADDGSCIARVTDVPNAAVLRRPPHGTLLQRAGAAPRLPLVAWLLGCAVAVAAGAFLVPPPLAPAWHRIFVALAVASSTLPSAVAGAALRPAVPALIAAGAAWLVGTPASTPALMVFGLVVAVGFVTVLAVARSCRRSSSP